MVIQQLSNGVFLRVLCPSIFRAGKHVVLRDHLFPSSEHVPGDVHSAASSGNTLCALSLDVWLKIEK